MIFHCTKFFILKKGTTKETFYFTNRLNFLRNSIVQNPNKFSNLLEYSIKILSSYLSHHFSMDNYIL